MTQCIVDNVATLFLCVIVKFCVPLEIAVTLEPYARTCCCLPGQRLTWEAAVLGVGPNTKCGSYSRAIGILIA